MAREIEPNGTKARETRRFSARRAVPLATFLACVAIVWSACAKSDLPPAAPLAGHLGASRSLMTVPPLRHAKFDLAWVGQLHNQAMQELVASAGQWGNKRNGPFAMRRCKALSDIVTKYAAIATSRLNVSNDLRDVFVKQALSAQHCAGATPLMAWKLSPRVPSRSLYTFDDTVYGTYANYVGGLQSAMANGSTPDDVASGMDAVVASATDLGPGDAEVLEGIASTGESSAYYWYDQENSGAIARMIDSSRATSIFRMPRRYNFWGGLGWSDLSGAITGAAATCEWTGGACIAVPEAMLAGSVINAVGSSAGFLIGILAT